MKQQIEFRNPEIDFKTWAGRYKIDDKETAVLSVARRAKARGFLNVEEFRAIAKWKSPRPSKRHQRNSATIVEDVTHRAFRSVNDIERILLLTALDGVSVRTATAILHLCHADRYPLLDVRAMTALGVPSNETATWDELAWLRIWPKYIDICRQIAESTGMDMRSLDMALWEYGKSIGNKRRKN